ncbi:pantetheine-phosphate adenylyltransferase [bacterium]|jgi:pantetheine-phosphate adenylyltransferase|nr:pantetheine-phosphate adenylyltransferase [bacterium]
MKDERILLYPGSFDPPTMGHFDVVKRGLVMCESLVVGITKGSSGKKFLFGDEERKIMFESYLEGLDLPVKVMIYDGLTVDLATQLGAFGILRGLRTYTDFEHEFQMAAMNKHLAEQLETVFIRTDESLAHISSSMVKDVSVFKRIPGVVSAYVQKCLSDKLS